MAYFSYDEEVKPNVLQLSCFWKLNVNFSSFSKNNLLGISALNDAGRTALWTGLEKYREGSFSFLLRFSLLPPNIFSSRPGTTPFAYTSARWRRVKLGITSIPRTVSVGLLLGTVAKRTIQGGSDCN